MKRFILKLVRFLSIQGLIFSLFLFNYYLNHKKLVKNQYVAATIDKHSLLKHQQGPRMIFVGGSNIAFGIDSELIAKRLNYYPVNMGLHYALGLEYILNETISNVDEGDIVIISLEYENFINPLPENPETLLKVLDSRPKNFSFVPSQYIPKLLDKGHLYLGNIFRSSIYSVLGQYPLDDIYQRTSFNSNGDITVNHNRHQKLTEINADKNEKLKVSDESIQKSLNIIRDFNISANQKNVSVFFTYPPLEEDNYVLNSKEIRKISSAINKSELVILDKPSDMSLSYKYFFDSKYHLNNLGVYERSIHLINRLQKEMK